MNLIPLNTENFSRSAIGSYFDWQGATELRNMGFCRVSVAQLAKVALSVI
ncbi:hypothetical protein [Yersinia massiliensis]|nr:hypothetical protein [Yersinia massiliensis]MCB5320419.1 hypothetical protein [Yersinia massiliensis]